MESFWQGVNWGEVLAVAANAFILFGVPLLLWVVRTFVKPQISKTNWDRIVSAVTVVYGIVESMGIKGDGAQKLKEGLRLVSLELGRDLSAKEKELVSGMFSSAAFTDKKKD